MIQRLIESQIRKDLFKKKAILLLGARQVGKSTLLKNMFHLEKNVLWLDAENSDVQLVFQDANATRLQQFFGENTLIIIDEAQKIEQIGSKLKLITDHLSNIQVIATGSSAFELRNKLNEPLTGRKFEYHLFPLSFQEMVDDTNLLEEKRKLPHRLVFGCYPEIVMQEDQEERLLRTLSDSYLYKDVLLYKGIRKPEKILELLKLLAWQIGQQVSIHELSNHLEMKSETVEDYLHLLEQSFIVYRLNSYFTNKRKELKKSKKIYFNDLGVRNALINDFRPLEIRNDKGNMFENYIINELRKKDQYERKYENFYFWRSQQQAEIDLVCEKNNQLKAIEIKWDPENKARIPKTFQAMYPKAEFHVIHSENYYEFLLNEKSDFQFALVGQN